MHGEAAPIGGPGHEHAKAVQQASSPNPKRGGGTRRDAFRGARSQWLSGRDGWEARLDQEGTAPMRLTRYSALTAAVLAIGLTAGANDCFASASSIAPFQRDWPGITGSSHLGV